MEATLSCVMDVGDHSYSTAPVAVRIDERCVMLGEDRLTPAEAEALARAIEILTSTLDPTVAFTVGTIRVAMQRETRHLVRPDASIVVGSRRFSKPEATMLAHVLDIARRYVEKLERMPK